MSVHFPVKECCEFFCLARSSYYRQPQPQPKPQDAPLRRHIKDVAARFAVQRYGSRRVTGQLALAPYNMRVGRNRVRRLMGEMGYLQEPKRRRGTTNSKHGYGRYANLVKGIKAQRPEHIWAADITQFSLRSRQAYLAIIMDLHTRAIRGWALSWSQSQQLTLDALDMAMDRHGAPDIHHSDQGSQYAASKYIKRLTDAGAKVSMAGTGKPQENGYAERLIRTIKEEEVIPDDYQTLTEARAALGRFIEVVYMRLRVHSALGYLPPARFEAEWRKQNTP